MTTFPILRQIKLVALSSLVLIFPLFSSADELESADRKIEEVIDHYIEAELAIYKVKPAGTSRPETLLRRTMLDLVGRPPTAVEIQKFHDDPSASRRESLVDQLMNSEAFADHQSVEFNTMLMLGVNGNLTDYLKKAFSQKRAWDAIFRELVLAEVDKDKKQGADGFVKSRVNDLDKLANDSSVAFFGVNISCAQCHDHPVVIEWTQDHFYGMKSFFSRTFESGGFVGERNYGTINYKTTKGETRKAQLTFLTGTVVDEPESKTPDNNAQKAEKKKLDELKKKKLPPPKPSFSRRQALVEFALKPEQRHFFARAIVNRVWYRMMGHGLVMPLDQMHPENESTHPQLLEWLARDLINHQYDLRRLIRGIALSNAYARSSRWESTEERPEQSLYAVGNLRPLTPLQYAKTLTFASRNPDYFQSVVDKPEEFAKRVTQTEKQANSLASLFEQPGAQFQVSVTEALVLSNSEKVQNGLLKDGNNQYLISKLNEVTNDSELVDMAIKSVLGRTPEKEEKELLTEFLAKRSGNRKAAVRQIVWALLTSGENRFNY